MAWSVIPTVTAGQVLTAAHMNALKANSDASPNALATVAGQLFYVTAAGVLVPLNIGTAGQVLKVNSGATAPEWATQAPPTFATLPAVYAAHVYRSSAQTISNGSATAVSWNAERYDLQAMHDLVTNPSRITIPVGGYIVASVSVLWTTNTTGIRILEILKNGSAVAETRRLPNSGLQTWQEIHTQADAAASDYFEVRVTHDSGGNLDLVSGAASTRFAVAVIPGPQ